MTQPLSQTTDPFNARDTFDTGSGSAYLYRLDRLEEEGYDLDRLPVSIRILLEGLLRRCDGETVTEAITVTVNGANDAPLFTSGMTFSVDENTIAVTTVTAVDPDVEPLSFSITGGADEVLFNIDATTDALSFAAAPDCENPQDDGADNTYEVEVTVSDGDAQAAQTISVMVEDVDEGPDRVTVTGTPGIDYLVGTGADEIIDALGGPIDTVLGGGGSDIFVFNDGAGRDSLRILDYELGIDQIDLNGGTVLTTISGSFGTMLRMASVQGDSILVLGVTDAGDLDFV